MSKISSSIAVSILAANYYLNPAVLQAQATAALVGTIRDSSGAPIPEAKVTALNVRTGLRESRVTGVDGSYSIPLLPVGEYRLQVEAAGFQAYVRTGITLAVNDKPTIDVILNVGNLADSVTVTATAPLLETQTGALRGLVDRQRIVNLPLNGRNMTQLISLQAGAIQTSDLSSTGEGVSFAVNGSRQNGVYYLLDGGYNTSTYRNFSGTFPNPDAVQEFSVQRSNFSAEYANATGAVVNVITRSGTNEIHGSLFEFLRNGDLNARNFFAPRRDSLKRNQFGGTIGGPVLKDKLFYFASYQGTYLRSDPQLSQQYLPTAAYRNGDFSGLKRTITDPASRLPFPNAQIPVSRFNPVSVNFLKYIPVPASVDGLRFTGTPNIVDSHEVTGRLDWNLTRHRFSGKFFRSESTSPFIANPNDIAFPLLRKDSQPYWHVSGNYFFMASPSLINNVTFSWRYRARLDNWGGFEYPINFQSAGVRNIAVKKPAGTVFNVNGFFNVQTTWPYEIEDGDWYIGDTLTVTRGRHELRLGGEFIRSTNVIRNDFRTMGNFTFDGSATGSPMTDFFLGEVYSFLQGGGEFKDMSGRRFGIFAQDDWRVHPSLTLNLGIRWDPTFPYSDALGRMQCIRPGQTSTRFPRAPVGYLSGGDAGCPVGGFESYYNAVAPRFGFAWRSPIPKTVFRGGFGLFWMPQFTAIYQGFINGAPFSPQINRFGVKLDNPYENTPNPFPASFAPFVPPSNSEFTTPLGLIGSFEPNFRPSFTETFNFTVEREIGNNLLARVSYVGNLGRHLAYNVDTNYGVYIPGNSSARNLQDRRPLKDFGQILSARSEGTSSYHGLQVSLERRFANLTFEANYTWSRSIDEYSADPTPGQSSSLAIPFSRWLNRGLSDFDVRHRAVGSIIWALPRFKGQSRFVRYVLGNWEAASIITLQGGRPFTVLSGLDNSQSGVGRDNADLIGNPYLDTSRPRRDLVARYFNPSAYAPNALGTFGTSPRNLLIGPGMATMDAALVKAIPIRERHQLRFRAEFFNALNRPNFNAPFATQNNPARFGRLESAADPRIIQFALKFQF